MAGPLCTTHLVVVVVWFAYVVPLMCHQIIKASLACCYDLFLLTFFLSFLASMGSGWVIAWPNVLSFPYATHHERSIPSLPWWDALNEEPTLHLVTQLFY